MTNLDDPYFNCDTCVNRLFDEYKKYGKLIIACDWDVTLYDYHKKGFKYPKVIELLKECQELNFYICIFTGSPKDKYLQILEDAKNLGLKISSINQNPFPMPFGNDGKIYFNHLLDDRAALGMAYQILRETVLKIKNPV